MSDASGHTRINTELLSRDEFCERVLLRDHNACVICGASADDGASLDVHHIMERSLWPDGGYYVENGCALCDSGFRHHLQAEQTLIAPEQLRRAAGITVTLLPPGLDDELSYDKWGNAYLPSGQRSPGPLFYEGGVQKTLRDAGVLDQFQARFKHPRTLHLPDSPNRGADGDHAHPDLSSFEGREVVVTLKMDGEGTTMTPDDIYARSLDSGYHHTRTWVANLHARLRHDIPAGWRVVGENLYGQHSIRYDSLPSYFLAFAMFNDKNVCLSWDEMTEWASLLEIDTVPVLYRGVWDEQARLNLDVPALYGETAEGYVVRWAQAFSYYQWHLAVGKYVRRGHVKDSGLHWRTASVAANKLQR